MSLCALILAHQQSDQLGRLARRLGGDGIESFIHIDARQDMAPFQAACASSGARFLRHRIPVFWGGFSMIEAVTLLARNALAGTSCTHFVLLSGDSYPLLSGADIKVFLLRNSDFIDIKEFRPGDKTFDRIANVYLPDVAATALRAAVDHQQRCLDDKFFLAVDGARAIYDMKKSSVFPWRYAKGSNWWCLRRQSLERCLELGADENFARWFRYSANPDESYFATLMMNFFPGENFCPSPMCDIWDRKPRPYEFRALKDLHLLLGVDRPFARKFGADSSALLDAIEAGAIANGPPSAFRALKHVAARCAGYRARFFRW